ncbi:MAG: 4Fe-4S binding protein [Oscillospiraceae bacterium]|nr:4Fe-4S binding protein [Oscillospiraceae bacterium]
MKPYLREKSAFSFEEIPEKTCFEAGYLVTKNSGWRRARPVIDKDKCVMCLQCYLYCPDGVISESDNNICIDYDFCKGCGICGKICKAGAIKMEAEV